MLPSTPTQGNDIGNKSWNPWFIQFRSRVFFLFLVYRRRPPYSALSAYLSWKNLAQINYSKFPVHSAEWNCYENHILTFRYRQTHKDTQAYTYTYTLDFCSCICDRPSSFQLYHNGKVMGEWHRNWFTTRQGLLLTTSKYDLCPLMEHFRSVIIDLNPRLDLPSVPYPTE